MSLYLIKPVIKISSDEGYGYCVYNHFQQSQLYCGISFIDLLQVTDKQKGRQIVTITCGKHLHHFTNEGV